MGAILNRTPEELAPEQYAALMKSREIMLRQLVGEMAMQGIGMFAKPLQLMRYFGSKSGQAKLLAERIAPITGTYREPFLGSGTIFRQLFEKGKILGKVELAEANPLLRDIYAEIRRNPKAVADVAEQLSEAYRKLPSREAKQFAVSMLDKLKGLSGAERAGAELFVGQHSVAYNPPMRPLMRYSSKYITPEGLSRRIKSFGKALKETKATVRKDWKEALANVKKGDVIIADPPYHGRRGYSVGWNESEEFARVLSKTRKRGAAGIVWNSPEALEIYQPLGFKMQETGWLQKLPEYAASWGEQDLVKILLRQ